MIPLDTLARWTMILAWCIGWPLLALTKWAESEDLEASRSMYRAAYQECVTSVSTIEGYVARSEVHQAYLIQALEHGFGVRVTE